jgi:hypothetical protein
MMFWLLPDAMIEDDQINSQGLVVARCVVVAMGCHTPMMAGYACWPVFCSSPTNALMYSEGAVATEWSCATNALVVGLGLGVGSL